ncbi:L-type lectin-domain containing receptor kinase IX.1 [Triticum urartu]|uniref:L-type lectin-domain containing receptor kinase IX.1 n=1 Tax=Triticum urartu TaxID=4572 RepID=M7Z966_TRIUA|nr:L-type lectin-domain containing receptor kinase IX.1 [Triticum urartu]
MRPHRLLLVSVYTCLSYSSSLLIATALSFSFNFSSSDDLCDTELRCEHDARMVSGAIELTKNELKANFFSVGRASYARRVPLWNNATGEVASFSSNFTFRIRPKNETDENLRLCSLSHVTRDGAGDGMAFFLAHFPSRLPPNSVGENLALFNDSNRFNAAGDDRTVAVEFDAYPNSWDHSDNHVGIDVNSIDSRAYTNVTKRLVSDDAVMTAEISYDNRTGVLIARLRIDGDKPYMVNASVDMKANLPHEVAIGFAASTGICSELHQVMSWLFSSTLDDATVATSSTSPRRRLVRVLSAFRSSSFSCVALRHRCHPSPSATHMGEAEFERGVGPRRYRYRELVVATKDFAEEGKLGRGGFGNVDRGSLSDQDRPVAIKMLSAESSAQGRKEFESEVKIISRLRHRNLVHLLGWSDSRKGLLLVYELVPEGSLDRHIYNTDRLLTWSERYRIILGLGSAVRYLHTEWDQCVLHGDIKPSNILLDSSRSTKLADFGLARLVEHGAGPRTTHVVMGTAGYIDPEFVRTRRPITESDVYSFGIVVLEWIWNLYEKGAIVEAVDERLKGDKQLDDCKWQLHRALVVGLWCTHPRPGVRPSVVQLMNVLQSEDVTLPTLSRPGPSDISPGSHAYNASSSVNVCSDDVSWATTGR